MKKLLLSLLAVVCSVITASADTSTLTLASGDLSGLTTSKDKTVATTKGFKWTFSMTGTGTLQNFDSNTGKGYQFGSAKAPISTLTITSEGFAAYKITKVTINTSGASSVSATVGVSVNGVTYKNNEADSYSLTSTGTDVAFEGEATGEITVSYSVSSKAIYVKSIVVEYTESDEVVKKQAHLSFPQHDYYVSVAKVNDFVAPELDNPNNVSPITFESSDESIAIVDENTGDVALESTPGEVTITAKFPGNDDFEADEQTYVIHILDGDQYTVTFDFEKNDYGMIRYTGSDTAYNPAGTKFGEEWVVCTANEHTRLWWSGKEPTATASGNSMRIYSGGEIVIETPAGTEISHISIYHYNDKGDAEDVTDDADHEHVTSIEGNKAVLAADWGSGKHELSAVEVTYMGKSDVMDAVVDAFKAGKHDNGDSHFTVKVNGVEQVSHSISFASADEEPTQVEFSHYYPHATIYTKFEPAAAPAVYYDAAEGFTEHTAPITLTGSGTLSYYAEMNGHTTPVQTVAVADTTTSISEVNSSDKAAEVYDLQGRRVQAPARGLYIVGGKLQLK